MAKQKERKLLERQNWTQNFTLIGEAELTDYTYKLDEKSNKSDWIYNALNLGVDCGEKHGKVYCELMGGYGSERDNNVIYVHGKKDDNSDDFKNQYTIAWEDRFEESILEDIGDLCFLTVGLEKDSKDKTFYKKFLTPYDAIAYINEHLEDGMVVNVKGQLRYTVYNNTVQCRKEVNSIVLSKATPDKYRASFIQTMLLDKDSAGKDSIDKDKGVLNVYAYVLEKFKEYNGWDLTNNGKIKGGLFVPLRKTYEFVLDMSKPDLTAKVINKVFKVKKGVTQVTFEGEFIESGATVTATEDDIPDDIKDLIDMGMFTLEEALEKCSDSGSKERRMIITRPYAKLVGEDDNKVLTIQKFDEQFDEEDLLLDCLVPKDEEVKEEEEEEEVPFEEETNDSVEEDDLAALLDALD